MSSSSLQKISKDDETSASAAGGRIVIVAVDGSDNSKYAFRFYVDNIRLPNDKLYLIHSVEMNKVLSAAQESSSPFTFNNESLVRGMDEESQRIRQKLKEYVTILKDVGLEGTLRSVNAESPGAGIVKAAKDLQATLIVMGTRGLGKLRRTFMGSVSDYVLHHAHVPVLICRRD